jgi:hypothetical protein
MRNTTKEAEDRLAHERQCLAAARRLPELVGKIPGLTPELIAQRTREAEERVTAAEETLARIACYSPIQ